ncbi:MAG: glycine/sarcosine/betaine reductase selenoprotein B family protein [Actinomycetota bacterium]|nr:glycine/sarcosine/betaine reductase selenoprotein B family protein [Actinomycetota bacterium]
MVRLSDLHPVESDHLRMRAEAMPAIGPGKWVTPPAVDKATVAMVSTAGLHRRTDPPFTMGSLDYRIIPGDIQFGDLVVSHISANFDRSAFGQDPNVVFPMDRLRELAAAGEIGGVARWHYSFMGAMPDPSRFEETGEEIGRLMAQDGVDVALLVPI